MSIPACLLTATCDIYRPFGAGSPTTSNVACRLAADLPAGTRPAGALTWTHTLDVQPGVEIRDGCSRTAGANAITYADGDEIRVPSGGGTRYVVVWVETVNCGASLQYQRAYLLRHVATWPNP